MPLSFFKLKKWSSLCFYLWGPAINGGDQTLDQTKKQCFWDYPYNINTTVEHINGPYLFSEYPSFLYQSTPTKKILSKHHHASFGPHQFSNKVWYPEWSWQKLRTFIYPFFLVYITQREAESAWDIPYLNRKIFLFRYQIFKSYFFCH